MGNKYWYDGNVRDDGFGESFRKPNDEEKAVIKEINDKLLEASLLVDKARVLAEKHGMPFHCGIAAGRIDGYDCETVDGSEDYVGWMSSAVC